MKKHSKRYTVAIATVSALGAILTTLVALTDHSDPAYVYEAALLAGVTAVSVALAREISNDNEDDTNDE